MNIKRFISAGIAVFVGFEVIDAIIHMGILGQTYMKMSIWRPDMMSLMWVMHVGGIVLAFLFVYIFVKGYENKGIWEGVRFGLVLGLFANIPYAFYSYALYPLPFSLCLQWFIYGMIEFVICGALAAAIYRSGSVYD